MRVRVRDSPYVLLVCTWRKRVDRCFPEFSSCLWIRRHKLNIVFNRYVYIRTPIFTTDVSTFCYVLSWVKSLFLIKMNHDVSGENTLYHTFLWPLWNSLTSPGFPGGWPPPVSDTHHVSWYLDTFTHLLQVFQMSLNFNDRYTASLLEKNAYL